MHLSHHAHRPGTDHVRAHKPHWPGKRATDMIFRVEVAVVVLTLLTVLVWWVDDEVDDLYRRSDSNVCKMTARDC